MSDCLRTSPSIRPSVIVDHADDCCYREASRGGCAVQLPVGGRCEESSPQPFTYKCLEDLEDLIKIHPLLPSARTNPMFAAAFDCMDDLTLGRLLRSLECFNTCGCPPDLLLYVAAHFLTVPIFDSAMRLNLLEGGKIAAFPKDHWMLTTWGTIWKQLSTARISPVFGGF
jgi:hypothetical protein